MKNYDGVLPKMKLPAALDLKWKVKFWRQNGSISKAQNPSKSPKLQLNIISHYMALNNISFYQAFYSSLIDNEIIIIPREKFVAPKWYHSINNTKQIFTFMKLTKPH